MRERPLLCSGYQVCAILDGRMTQTRRVIKHQPIDILPMKTPNAWVTLQTREPNHGKIIGCRFGQPGDRLWVRESFSYCERILDPYYLPVDYPEEALGVHYWADGNPQWGNWTRPKPSIHMPRWASRITLEIVNIRVERVQNISKEGAIAEGINMESEYGSLCVNIEDAPYQNDLCKGSAVITVYKQLWDSLNAKRGYSWASNPWVWVIEFKKVEGEK